MGWEDPMSPMNPSRRTVNPVAHPLLPLGPLAPMASIAWSAWSVTLVMLLTIAPCLSPAAQAQTLREAGIAEAAAASQAQMLPQIQPQAPTKSCVAKAQDWLKECEADEAENEAENRDGRRDRSGLGWTGIGLASAGGAHLAMALTVSRWRSCGPNYVRHCRNLERVYGTSGGTLLATGLTFLIIDEVRRHPKPSAKRQTAIAIGPRAIQVRMLF